MLSFKHSDHYMLYIIMQKTNRESQCHGQKLLFSFVKTRYDESTIVPVLRSPPVLHDSRAYVNLISRRLWDICLNPKGFW